MQLSPSHRYTGTLSMKRSRQSHALRFLVMLALLAVTMLQMAAAQTEAVMPADAGATDAATVEPAGGSSATSSAAAGSPVAATGAPATTYPATTPTVSPTTIDAAATAAPAITEAPTAAPAVTETPTAVPVATEAPTAAPVPTEAPTATPVPTTAPAATPVAPAATEAPTAAPVPTEAPTAAPAATEVPTAVPAATTQAPAATTSTPTAPPIASSSSSASDSTSSKATQSSTDSGTDTSTSKSVGTSGGLTLSPINSDDGDADTDADKDTSDNGSEPTNTSTSSGTTSSFGGWKLIIVIVGAVCAVVASIFLVHMRHVRSAAANKRSRGSSQQRALDSFFRQNRVTVPRETGVSSGNFVTDPLTPRDEIAVTLLSNNQERPRTKTADLIAGSAAQAFNRRTRPKSSSGSIDTTTENYSGDDYDSFVGRHHSSVASSGVYGSNSVHSDASSISLGSIVPSSQRSFAPSGLSIDQHTRPRLQTVSSQGRSSKRASSATSIGASRDTNRSDRSSSDFSVFNSSSVSTDDDIYRISTQLIDVSAIPPTTSEKSEPNSRDSYPSSDRLSDLSDFSVDESYTSNLSIHERFAMEISIDDNESLISYGTADSFASSNNSLVFRNSKESELSEGEI